MRVSQGKNHGKTVEKPRKKASNTHARGDLFQTLGEKHMEKNEKKKWKQGTSLKSWEKCSYATCGK
jgi:hypothetical protein